MRSHSFAVATNFLRLLVRVLDVRIIGDTNFLRLSYPFNMLGEIGWGGGGVKQSNKYKAVTVICCDRLNIYAYCGNYRIDT